MEASIEERIGRREVDDIEAILSVSNTDVDEALHAVRSSYDTIFTWDYDKGSKPKLGRLYEKAKHSMWNAETDLDWTIEVDQHKLVAEQQLMLGPPLHTYVDLSGTPLASLGRQGVDPARCGGPELDPLPVHARRAGGARVHGQGRRVRAVDRRQVLRRDPGHGRGPPRRGLRQVPRLPSSPVTTRSTPTCACCSTTSSPTAAGT